MIREAPLLCVPAPPLRHSPVFTGAGGYLKAPMSFKFRSRGKLSPLGAAKRG